MQCHTCGRPYDDSFPDWSICGNCLQQQVGEDKYIDSLGIVWSQDELQEVGGVGQVEVMCQEADARRK